MNHTDWDAVIVAPFGKLGIQTEIVDDSLMVRQIVYLDHSEKLKPARTDLAKEVENQFSNILKIQTSFLICLLSLLVRLFNSEYGLR